MCDFVLMRLEINKLDYVTLLTLIILIPAHRGNFIHKSLWLHFKTLWQNFRRIKMKSFNLALMGQQVTYTHFGINPEEGDSLDPDPIMDHVLCPSF